MNRYIPALIGAAFITLIVIAAIAFTAPHATPEPAPTVTATTTTTATATVTAQPAGLAACKDALQDADHLNTTAAGIGTIINEHIQHDSTLLTQLAANDWTGLADYTLHIEDMTSDIQAITDEVNASTYRTNRAACLAAIGEQA